MTLSSAGVTTMLLSNGVAARSLSAGPTKIKVLLARIRVICQDNDKFTLCWDLVVIHYQDYNKVAILWAPDATILHPVDYVSTLCQGNGNATLYRLNNIVVCWYNNN